VRTFLLLGVGCAVLLWLLSGFDWGAVGAQMSGANYAWLPVAAAITVAYLFVRSWRWWYLLRVHQPGQRFWPVHAANAVGVGLGNFSPAQSGELVKIELLARASGLARTELASPVLLERLLDILVLGGLLAAGLPVVLRAGLHLALPLGSLALYIVAPGLLIVLLAGYIWRGPTMRILGLLHDCVRRPRVLLVSLGLSLLAWGTVLLTWMCLAWFLRIEMSALHAVALMSCVTVLRLLSLVPGGIGVDEAGIIGLMRLLQYSAPEAQAYALAGRISDVVMLGIALVFARSLRRRHA
jgi:uncharacterized membrane protein YbhN (UPF0104 family)